jgi:putative ABC transport system permease protein
LFFVLFAVVFGGIAGVLPAILLSGIKPLMLMQKLQKLRLFRHMGMRKGLLAVQFMISLVFISMVTIMHRQLSYAMNINFGSRQTHIFNIELQGMNYAKAAAEFNKIPGVEKISAVSNLMGDYTDMAEDIRISKEKDPITVREYFTDENYINNMNLQMVAGKNFPGNHAQKREQFAIVNEQFVKNFQLGTSEEAVGKTFTIGDSIQLTICGVVKDFLFKPADYALAPMLLRYEPAKWSILNVRLASGNMIQTTSQLEAVGKKLDPFHSFRGQFYEQNIQAMYADIRDIIWMIAFISFLGITIACLGLLGITLFTIQSKTKEISIRKVIGASPASLVKLLSRSYLQVMLIAIALAVPITSLLAHRLLQEMSQRISIGVSLFIPGIAIMILLSALTIGSQTLSAALVNPVKGLKEE